MNKLLTVIIFCLNLYNIQAQTNPKLCMILRMIESKECAEATSQFCKMIKQTEERVCPHNDIINYVDIACKYRECPTELPYCYMGMCSKTPFV